MGRDYRVQEEGKKLVITLEHIIRLPGLKIFLFATSGFCILFFLLFHKTAFSSLAATHMKHWNTRMVE